MNNVASLNWESMKRRFFPLSTNTLAKKLDFLAAYVRHFAANVELESCEEAYQILEVLEQLTDECRRKGL